MKKLLILLFTLLVLFISPMVSKAEDSWGDEDTEVVEETAAKDSTEHYQVLEQEVVDPAHNAAHEAAEGGHGHGPSGISVIPFALLLLLIATGPLFFEHFWHHYYPHVAIGLGVGVCVYYAFGLHDTDSIIHSGAEYVQFIALLAALFMAAGGIMINVDKEGKPMVNVMMLIFGAILANLIGTTGASMLLIRPFIRLNKDRIKAYHIIFFIFMVSNVGGSLTPIGDPPLFLGFLKGVPFIWTVMHNIVPWAFAVLILAAIFYIFDSKNKSEEADINKYSGEISITGGINFIWIALIIGCVFIDPNVFESVPSIQLVLHGQLTKISFIRETLMLSIACLSYYFANKEALKGNEFNFEPIKEVAFIFIGIFFTMMPALQLVGEFAKSPEGREMITISSLYWGTGALSGVLDNAPTYVNFLTAAISSDGGSITNVQDVAHYAFGDGKFAGHESTIKLTAISIASVFFGAMTYIGNAPNFMVKSIAESAGIKMPAFVEYIYKYSLIILLPVLFIVWLVFFYFHLIEYCFIG